MSDPIGLRGALRLAEQALSSSNSVRVVLAEGRYRFREGFDLEGVGSSDSSGDLRIAPVRPGAAVVFDGSVEIDVSRFEPVSEASELDRLAETAAGRVVAQTIEDERLARALGRKLVTALAYDGQSFLPSRFPNEGYATLASEVVEAEVSPPAVPSGREGYGVRAGHAPFLEEGRPAGWLGSLAEPRGAWVRIGTRTEERAGSWAQWQAELERNNRRNQLTGFLDANWLRRSQPLVAADSTREAFHLSQALAYGWSWRQNGKPFFVHGLLCELDSPGEWHFDVETRRLFFWPPTPIGKDSRMSLPVADGFLRLKDCHHVTVEGITVENVASGTVFDLEGGSHNSLLGVEVCRSSALGVQLSGRFQQVRSSDLFDLHGHVRLAGGRRGPGELLSGGNVVENCHIFQRRFRDQRIVIGISGVGNVFRNNLVHDSLGQPITVRGNDHLVERNEIFNVGYDEGDGGAIYSGGDLTGYGITYRHNFIHHLMHRPGKVERSGIHLDDLQAGATCQGNVFFKSAGKGIFMNNGAGHRIVDNVFIEGFRGVYNVGAGARRTHERQMAILGDPEHDYRGKKEDYVGNAERVVGPGGWNHEPWLTRFPNFAQVMNDEGEFGRLWPIRCQVRGNVYCGNQQGDAAIWSRVAPEARAKSVIENEVAVEIDAFVDADTLDFRFVQNRADLPRIPFAQIGLYVDALRAERPDPKAYRRAVRAFYAEVPCMPGTNTVLDSTVLVDAAPRIDR
ncbi:MAG: right-handed parallel beta-helix repeat-containing protein [Planctomycetota bacterium]